MAHGSVGMVGMGWDREGNGEHLQMHEMSERKKVKEEMS